MTGNTTHNKTSILLIIKRLFHILYHDRRNNVMSLGLKYKNIKDKMHFLLQKNWYFTCNFSIIKLLNYKMKLLINLQYGSKTTRLASEFVLWLDNISWWISTISTYETIIFSSFFLFDIIYYFVVEYILQSVHCNRVLDRPVSWTTDQG